MPKYRVLAPCFINNGLRAEGDIVDFDGPKGSALELIAEVRPAAKEERTAPVKPMDFPKNWGSRAKQVAGDE